MAEDTERRVPRYDTEQKPINTNSVAPIEATVQLKWSFDDLHIGKIKCGVAVGGGHRALSERIVARPHHSDQNEWYHFAGEICKILNKLEYGL